MLACTRKCENHPDNIIQSQGNWGIPELWSRRMRPGKCPNRRKAGHAFARVLDTAGKRNLILSAYSPRCPTGQLLWEFEQDPGGRLCLEVDDPTNGDGTSCRNVHKQYLAVAPAIFEIIHSTRTNEHRYQLKLACPLTANGTNIQYITWS